MTIPATLEPRHPIVMRLAEHALSAAGGLAVTLVILWGLARAPESVVEKPEPLLQEVRATDLPEPPPPPPAPAAELPVAPALLELELSPSNSSVKFPPAPLLDAPPQVGAPATGLVRTDFSPGDFRPRGQFRPVAAGHVFDPKEVDRRPVPVYQPMTYVPKLFAHTISHVSVRLLFIVNVDGGVENVHVLSATTEELGRRMAEAVQEWQFRPAVKDGRKVRCLVEQPIVVRNGNFSPFGLH